VPGVDVLDTAALVSWPVDALENGFVVDSQKAEVRRIAPEKILSIEAASLNWDSPSEVSVEQATELAKGTGDLVGLSETDLHLLALAIEKKGRMHTDDYRLQNLCSEAGLQWSTVDTEGISQVWTWEVACSGCGDVPEARSKTIPSRNGLGTCKICGSGLRISRKR